MRDVHRLHPRHGDRVGAREQRGHLFLGGVFDAGQEEPEAAVVE